MLKPTFRIDQESRIVLIHSRNSSNALVIYTLFIFAEAIHEIRSKVILYKEFLKLLYEDDLDKDLKLK